MSYKLSINIKPEQEAPLQRLLKALEKINLSGLNPDSDDYPAQVAAAATKVAPDKQTLNALKEVVGRSEKDLFYCDAVSVLGEFVAEGEYTNYDILTSLAQHVLRSGSPDPYAVLYEWDGEQNTSASQAIITRENVTWYELQHEQSLHSEALKNEPWLLSAESATERLLSAAGSSPNETDALREMVRVLAEAAGVSGRMRAIKDDAMQRVIVNINTPEAKP